ncbi:MAG: hypothetical protein QOH58_3072 [Thermoleophilaceae bacterium]|jgi:hypothetical protein|nr:hypothetical protein [Thermoleophilaceae bacterium]
MRKVAVALLASAVLLAPAAAAEAATLTLAGSKPCYRAGDTLQVGGSGYTPGASVDFALDGASLGALTADAAGNFADVLTVGELRGVRTRTVTATDSVNPANVGSAQFLGSALAVQIRPREGAAGRRLRISATGFTTGKRLYAHVLRRGYRRNLFVTKLRGPCRTGKARRRIIPGSAPHGAYTVQFDTKRRYSSKTKVFQRFRVTIAPRSAAAAGFQPRLTQTVLFSR